MVDWVGGLGKWRRMGNLSCACMPGRRASFFLGVLSTWSVRHDGSWQSVCVIGAMAGRRVVCGWERAVGWEMGGGLGAGLIGGIELRGATPFRWPSQCTMHPRRQYELYTQSLIRQEEAQRKPSAMAAFIHRARANCKGTLRLRSASPGQNPHLDQAPAHVSILHARLSDRMRSVPFWAGIGRHGNRRACGSSSCVWPGEETESTRGMAAFFMVAPPQWVADRGTTPI